MQIDASGPLATVFAAPGRYIQGRGAIGRLGEVLEQLKSERPLILRDRIVEEIMGEALGALSRLAGQLPELARRAERITADLDAMGERGIRLHGDTVEGIGEEVARHGRSQRVALWVIALAATASVAALLVSVL